MMKRRMKGDKESEDNNRECDQLSSSLNDEGQSFFPLTIGHSEGALLSNGGSVSNSHDQGSVNEYEAGRLVNTAASASNVNNNAYGGARPKIFRARVPRSNGESSSYSRTSSESGAAVDIRVLGCDNENESSGGVTNSGQHRLLESQHGQYDHLPRLETRGAKRKSLSSGVELSSLDHDLELGDMVEDDCYIYTYIGGAAYLSADLPHSFYRSVKLVSMTF